jgi:long-chain acyl-CoA synthetase
VLESLVVERNFKLEVIIVPDNEALEKDNVDRSQLNGVFETLLKNVNYRLPTYSKVVNVELRETEFEKTPKRSIRRFLYK